MLAVTEEICNGWWRREIKSISYNFGINCSVRTVVGSIKLDFAVLPEFVSNLSLGEAMPGRSKLNVRIKGV